MENISRTNTPVCLSTEITGRQIYKRKGVKWSNKYNGNNSGDFKWGQFQGRKINHRLVESLQNISESHCFYCDKKGVTKGICTPTIDHFIPKTVKPLLAYFWSNLFLCCTECQNYKKEEYSKNLLKFDRNTYSFDDYYLIDYATGKIRTRIDIGYKERYMARYTLTLLGVNKDARPNARLEEVIAFGESINNNYNDFSYRFYLERNII